MKDLTLNYHFIKACNYKCRFCFATFNSIESNKLNLENGFKVINKCAESNIINRINYVGGEPTLRPDLLIPYLELTSQLSLKASIVTNGSRLLKQIPKNNLTLLQNISKYVSEIGVSIDSLDPFINQSIGRTEKKESLVPNKNFYLDLIGRILDEGITVKINTVVNKFNLEDNSVVELIEKFNIKRWNVFQAKPVPNKNDYLFGQFKISNDEFEKWISYNLHPSMVPETSLDMNESYLMVSPEGKFYTDTLQGHNYSLKSLFEEDVQLIDLIKDSTFRTESYYHRGGR